jgi:hypothetical protein
MGAVPNETRSGGEIDLAPLCALGNLGITLGDTGVERRTLKERSGWRYISFPDIAVKAELPSVVQTIEQAVQRLGGLAA